MRTKVGTNGATTLACEFFAMCTTCLVECLYYCMPAFSSSRVRVGLGLALDLLSGWLVVMHTHLNHSGCHCDTA